MINGELLTLSAGPYEAVVATSGGMLVSLACEGRDLVLPFDAEASLPSGWQGKTMLPWPNRVAGSRYTWGGQVLELACNEPATGCANHGLVSWEDWTVVGGADGDALSGSSVTMEYLMPATYGYPWSLLVSTTYQLHAVSGLSVTTSALCLAAALPTADTVGAPDDAATGGLAPAPFGVAAHPYLTRGVPLEECVLTLPGGTVLLNDEQKVPCARQGVEGTGHDWREGRRVGDAVVDNAYTDLPAGVWEARLARAEGGPAVVLSSATRYAQVYTADHMGRRGVAVEPMTCPANAFNTGEGLVTLAVGESCELSWSLRETGAHPR